MDLRIGVMYPRSLTIWPTGATIQSRDSDQLLTSNSLSPSDRISPIPSGNFSQAQDTIMVSPDDATTLLSLQEVQDSQSPSPSPNTQPPSPPPPAAPGLTTSPVPPMTVTKIQSVRPNTLSIEPPQTGSPPPPVTTTVQSIIISESISVSKVVSVSQIPETLQGSQISPESTKTVVSTSEVAVAAYSSTQTPTETQPESTSSSEASSTPSDSTVIPQTFNRHGAPFYIGVSILCVLGVAILSTFVAWLVRARSRRKQILRRMTLSWDPEKSAKGEIPPVVDTASFKDLESPHIVESWNISRERDVGEPRRSDSFGTPFPMTSRLRAGDIDIDTPHLLPPHLRTPFNFREPHFLNPATPEIDHTLGPLTIANMMPGDVTLSGYEPSRGAKSTSGSEFGTPNERMAEGVPRFLSLGSGLSVPWAPKSKAREARQFITSADNLRMRFRSRSDLPEPVHVPESWTSSLKSNLATAFHTIVGTPSSSSTVDVQEDLLSPMRPRSARQLMYRRGTGIISRRSSISTLGYSLEETSDGRGIVHLHSLSSRPSLSGSRSVEVSRKAMACSTDAVPEDAQQEEPRSGSFSTTSSVYSGIDSTSDRLPTNISSLPPRLPRLPIVRALTLREREGHATEPTDASTSDEDRRMIFSDERQTQAAISMPRISRELTTISTMSRQSSLTDSDEREARRVLMMRRKRAIALSRSGVGRGTTRRPSVRRFGSKMGVGFSTR